MLAVGLGLYIGGERQYANAFYVPRSRRKLMETDRMMSSKTAIRKHMLHKRALSPAEVESLSRAIGRKLMEQAFV